MHGGVHELPKAKATFFNRKDPEMMAKLEQVNRKPPVVAEKVVKPTEVGFDLKSRYDIGISEFDLIQVEKLQAMQESHDLPDPKTGLVRAGIPDNIYNQIIQKCKDHDNFVSLTSKAIKWEEFGAEEGVKIWTCIEKDWFHFRSESEIDLPLEVVAQYLVDHKFRLSYDKNLANISTLKTLTPQVEVIHTEAKGSWPISDRDGIMLRSKLFYKGEDGKERFRLVGFGSEELNKEHPPKKGVVRISVDCMGAIFTKLGPNKVHYLNFSRANPHIGGAPDFIIRKKMKENGLFAHVFAQACIKAEKEKEKNKK